MFLCGLIDAKDYTDSFGYIELGLYIRRQDKEQRINGLFS